MTKRTDIHRPAALVPADYTHVLTFAHSGTEHGFPVPPFAVDVLMHMLDTLPFFRRAGVGRPCPNQCQVCGALFRFGDVFAHASGEHIVVGWECAAKIQQLDRTEFSAKHGELRDRALAEGRRVLMAQKRAEFLRENDGLEDALALDHHILADLQLKLKRYGDLSPAQVGLAFKIAGEVRERARRAAEEAALPKAEVVEGKALAVVAEILNVKWHDSDFGQGGSLKMTLRVTTPAGAYKLWGTMPSALEHEHLTIQNTGDNRGLRGAVVEFTADVTKSDRDPTFGVFKRPRKPRIVSQRAPSPEVAS